MCAFAPGCAGDVLVERGDAVFACAQQRLLRTRELVDAAPAPAQEKMLFLQAEALYRYRFAPPARGFASYAAQVVAVATEFAPLQALAASAGMFELRLRGCDGAVQLWETLLDRYPSTALRPLALYRLGWAYRNLRTSGFPRESGDEAWQRLGLDAPGTPLAAAAARALVTSWKSRDAALAWSMIPGAGQMYAGEWTGGLVRLGLALVATAAIVAPIIVIAERGSLKWPRDWPYIASPLVGIVALNVVFTNAYQEADRAVVEWNERREAAFEIEHPEVP